MLDDGVSEDHSVASHLAERRGAKGGGGVIVRGLDCFFRCCTQGPWFLGRSRPGCTGPVRGGGSVGSVLHTYPGLVGLVGNVSSPALKGRHKSAIKASNSETMVNVCK